jgi:hypothetical protein
LNTIFGDPRNGRIHRVHAFAEDGELPTSLASARALAVPFQKRQRVLEVIAGHDTAKRLPGRQRHAVTGIHVADFSLRNGHKRRGMHAVLPTPVAKMHTTAQQLRRKPGFAIRSMRPFTEPLADTISPPRRHSRSG